MLIHFNNSLTIINNQITSGLKTLAIVNNVNDLNYLAFTIT